MSDPGNDMPLGDLPLNAIAVVGMAGRFPGARNVDAFWRNLCNGVESITHFEDSELEDSFGPEVRRAPNFVRARPILPDVEFFDAPFFGMYPREAELTDPQHRVFLECAWEALEDGGYDPTSYAGAIGVIAGCSMNTYFLHHVVGNRGISEDFTNAFQVGQYPMLLGASAEFLATRVSYKLNLNGPSFTLNTACSTSLMAIAQACQQLMLYQCDMAIAGGVSITFPQRRGYLSQEGGMVSEDGHCRTFDADANGTVFGSGAGAVLLKRLEDAVADGDHIYAVVRGTGVNNDGSAKVGFTAPSSDGQANAIMMAHANAGIEPRSIGYVECHGTATPLGDPIEIAGLTKAFRATGDDAKQFCAIGSVKSNIGHLDAAAGVVGFIKTALSLQHRLLPPMLHFKKPNPRLDIENTPFFVNAALNDWPGGSEPRRAGVSAFGVGGTNVHIVLEEAPVLPTRAEDGKAQVLVLSARSETALGKARTALAEHLHANPGLALADVAHTLQAGRRAFDYRWSGAARDHDGAIAALGNATGRAVKAAADPGVLFMFPGQGSQYPDMARDLYEADAGFRTDVDRCAQILRPFLDRDLREVLYPAERREDDHKELAATCYAQPGIFTVEYALGRLWMRRGIQPRAMIGHSVGEFVAACLAGVFTLEEVLPLVATRGRLMQDLPPGGMLAVRLPEAELAPLLDRDLAIAAINGPSLCVASGPHAAIDRLEAVLAARNVVSRRLHTSHAFHSPMMDPIIEPFTEHVRKLALQAPTIPYVSGVTGQWVTVAEATSPDYWARHFRQPVRFADGLCLLLGDDNAVLLEVGAGNTLTSLALQGAAKGRVVVPSLGDAQRERPDEDSMAEALGRLWAAGVPVAWSALRDGLQPRRLSLPTYPFERERHWVDAPKPAQAALQIAPLAAAMPEARISTDPTPLPAGATMDTSLMPLPDTNARENAIRSVVVSIFEDLSGEDVGTAPEGTTFLEMGFDSLFLTQAAQELLNKFGLKITFRALLGDLGSIDALTQHVAATLPPEKFAPTAAPAPVAAVAAPLAAPVAAPSIAPAASFAPLTATVPLGGGSGVEGLMRDQLQVMAQLMQQQLEMLRGGVAAPVAAVAPVPAPQPAAVIPAAPAAVAAPATPEAGDKDLPSRFAVYKNTQKSNDQGIDARQRAHIQALTALYSARSPGSKKLTQDYRKVLADPRAASGFNPDWKEMVYPVVAARSKGSRIWDVDGNEYIDMVNGYGQTMFGHAPDFVVEAVDRQLKEGFAIGPQSALTGKVATLFCEMTGNERVTFCNTGSEAVMAAMRVARTVTGRQRVVTFAGDYHGQFDEVLVKGQVRKGEHRSLPVAPGIPPQSVENVTVLEYGSDEALAWIRQHAGELAAVVVEPVQSRRPDLRPVEFLKQLRAVTLESGTALVFDEVVTGFRMHPGGLQAIFDVKADLACYGKVVGGGLPVGVLAGKAGFMDALDGGTWNYGDDSYPEVGVTFFAGTFVRHPLVLAALLAVLEHMKTQGPALQEAVTARMYSLVDQLQACFAELGFSLPTPVYGSMFYMQPSHDHRFGSLLYYHLRARGVYVHEGFPCFLTTEHTDADVAHIVQAFRESITAMQADGLLPSGGAAVATQPAIAAAPPKSVTPVGPISPTASQTEVWLSAQLGDEASCAFNESISLRFEGVLDAAALASSLDDVIARHDALRASFDTTGTLLHFTPVLHLDLPVIDLSAEASPEAALKARIEADAKTPFNLTGGPLVRAQLLRLAADRHVLVFTAHHIVCDGWSVNVLIGELSELYRGKIEKTQPVLAEPLPFSHYALGEQQSSGAPADEAYWVEQYRTAPPPLELPTDRPRPPIKTFNGGSVPFTIDKPLYDAVKKAGAKRGSTLFATLLAAFEILMGRLAGQNEVVVGIPAAGQSLIEDDRALVGHCVNLLPLRAKWQDGVSFADYLSATKQSVLDAYDHRSCTLGTILRKLTLPRDASRLPLAEVQFNLERLGGDLAFPGLKSEVSANPKSFSTFDLFANVTESANGLRIDCDYNTDLFDEGTILRWMGHYRNLLQAIAEDMSGPVDRLPLVASGDAVATLDGPVLPAPSDGQLSTIHGLFEAQAAATPHADAVFFENESVSYQELDRRAAQIAACLIRSGVPLGARVAVLVDRSVEMVSALLGVLKAGCSYVPLATNHPAARLKSILEEAEVAAVLTQAAHAALGRGELGFGSAVVIELDTERDAIASLAPLAPGAVTVAAADLAYVIFTSGSTGKPKGVEVSHGSVANFLASMRIEPGFAASDRLLAVTTISFDIAALELYLPLVAGGSVVIAPQSETADGFALLKRLKESGATVMQATPITWVILLESGFRPSPQLKMLCGGEALPRSLADQLVQNGGEVWNMYGPTETTIWSSIALITAGPEPITVGHPIANTQFHILDRFDRVVPVGVVGELHIGGDGVARGYFRRPELTAEKFIADPISGKPGARLYRTGDLARLMPGGRLQLLGRNDHQVKLRGFRIELGEIEAALGKAGLDVAAVILREDTPGDPRLVAYFEAPEQKAPRIEALRAAVAETLPDYMVPSQWVRLDVMPRNSSGKLDRRSLPKPDHALLQAQSTYVPPASEAEVALAQICAEVLGQSKVSIEDDLLALGADSIHIFQIVARANQAGLALSAKTLLQNRTIARAAATIATVVPPAERPDLPQLVRVARTGRRVAGASAAVISTVQSPER